jgi:hypothetical protein
LLVHKSHTIEVPKTNSIQHCALDFNLSRYKVTPSQATLENIEPTKAADIAEINVIPLIGIHDPVVTLSDDEAQHLPSWHPKPQLAAKKPKTIKPANDKILILLKRL